MRFFHTGVYPERYQVLVRAAAGSVLLEPFLAICPRCGDIYCADPVDNDGLGLADEAYAVTTWLGRECPDYAHVFLVAP